MRQSYLAGNWKMHKTVSESVAYATELARELKATGNKIMVAPPFTALAGVGAALAGSGVLLGAQNMCTDRQGAHTGEISVLMLKDVGVRVVILGHSERRHTYGETDSMINTKVKLALDEGLEVILCVGERLEEREDDRVEDVVKAQLDGGLANVQPADLARVTIAYEPVWAIGTGKTATPSDADAVHQYIRSWFSLSYDGDAAEKMVIQYGGSVKPGNIVDLMKMDNIDGALVGGASLKAETFLPIALYNE